MSMAQGKANFELLLAEKNNKVIALSGRWGTGKTHLWREVKNHSADDAIKKALYVSLFGLSTITELKLKAAQDALPVDAEAPWMDTIKSFGRAANKVAKGFHASFAALDEIALLAVPKMLEGRFIVIDDIERKHEKLTIEEVMGFIDDFTQNYKCRILLVLNTDQLGDKDVWEKLREKVIDQELRLETTPAEAFDIASVDAQSPFGPAIRDAVETCGVNNIRIVRKVIGAVDRILKSRVNLPPEVLARVIPSTVLLSALHYKGLDDGPDINYVLGLDEASIMRKAFAEADAEPDPEVEETKSRARWNLLLEKLRINGTDEYEKLVARYLASGQFDSTELAGILNRYCSEENLLAAQNRSREFFQRTKWHLELTDVEMLAEAQALLPDAQFLSPSAITSLHEYIYALPNGQPLADELISKWVDAFQAKPLAEGAAQTLEDTDMFDRPYHAAVKAAYDGARAQLHADRSLAQVLIDMTTSKGWGSREEAALKEATADDFEAAIKGASGQDLKKIVLKSMDLYAHRRAYESHFGSAMVNFLQACRNICANDPNARRVSLIRNVFAEMKRSADLDAVPSDTPPAVQ